MWISLDTSQLQDRSRKALKSFPWLLPDHLHLRRGKGTDDDDPPLPYVPSWADGAQRLQKGRDGNSKESRSFRKKTQRSHLQLALSLKFASGLHFVSLQRVSQFAA